MSRDSFRSLQHPDRHARAVFPKGRNNIESRIRFGVCWQNASPGIDLVYCTGWKHSVALRGGHQWISTAAVVAATWIGESGL